MIKRFFTSQLGQNIVTNYLSVVWMGALSLALIPLYLKQLGSEQWGVVAICMAFQGFLILLDAGLGQIMPRDVALVSDDVNAQSHVFAVFDRAYLALGLTGLILGQLAVSWLIEHWFNQGQGVIEGTDFALRLVLVQFLFQFANNAHTGLWNGLQKQVRTNFRQCVFGTLKHIGALTLIFVWQASALAYLIPFALISYIEWQINRNTVKYELSNAIVSTVTLEDFKLLGRQAGILSFGVIIGILVSQIDRIVLSKTVDITDYGHYVIVANLGLAFMQLQSPLMRAFFPRIVRAEVKPFDAIPSKNNYLFFWVTLLCVVPCAFAAMFSSWILTIWIGDETVVREGTTPMQLILAAVAINALYHIVYQKIIACGHNRLILFTNIITFFITILIVGTMANELGVLAGGLAWLVSSLAQLIFGWLGYTMLRYI